MLLNKTETETRPWGEFTTHACGSFSGGNFKVKTMLIEPNKRLSLQHHNKRKEVWIVAAGIAKVELGDQLQILGPGDTIHIPIGEKHRVTCLSPEECVIVELQLGEECSEKDIVRHEDDYART